MTQRKNWAIAITLYLLGIMMGALDTGIVTPARPLIAKDLSVSESSGIWMITIYTLTYAAAIPVVGKWADRIGRKPVFLVSIALFGLGSLLCGLAQDFGSFPLLLAARAIQAIGGGGILPIATAEISSEVPEEKRGMALGLVGAVFGVANIFGASAGSLILDIFGSHNWQWIFYINLPIAALIIALGVFALPNNATEETKPVDALGTLLLVGIIMSLLYGIKNLDFFHFADTLQSPSVWPFLVGSAVALPLLVLVERRAADPVLNLHYFTDRGIGLTLAISLLSGGVMMAVVFVPQLAENALHLPAGSGGYLVIVLGLASAIGAPLSGRLTDRYGAKSVLALGFGLSAVAAVVVVAWMIPHPSQFSVMFSLGLIGLGLGFVVGSPLSYMMLERTPEAESSSALGALSLVRSIGITLAPAIMVGFVVQGVSGVQTSLLDALPDKVEVPPLPYAEELSHRFESWKSDEHLADNLAGVELPDLTQTSVDVNFADGDGFPADLLELVQTADVTNIVERTKTIAQRMFADNTPETVAKIQSGVTEGIDGVRSALDSVTSSREEMSDGLSEMDGQLDEMTAGLSKMDGSLSEMTTGIKGMDSSLSEMTSGLTRMNNSISGMDAGVKKMDGSLSQMNSGLGEMDANLSAIDAGLEEMDGSLAQMSSGIEKMDKALPALEGDVSGARAQLDALEAEVARMDSNIAEKQSQLSELQNRPDTPPGEIAALEAALEQARQERASALERRTGLQSKLTALKAQRDQLTNKRRELVAARDALATQRAQTATGRDALSAQRDQLLQGRSELRAQREGLLQGRSELNAQRNKLAAGRTELRAQRTRLSRGRAELANQREKLAEGRSALTTQRNKLSTGMGELDSVTFELEDTITKLDALRDGVPDAFDQAMRSYLAEIDAHESQLEHLFGAAVGDGYRGVFLFDLVINMLALGLLALVPRATRPAED